MENNLEGFQKNYPTKLTLDFVENLKENPIEYFDEEDFDHDISLLFAYVSNTGRFEELRNMQLKPEPMSCLVFASHYPQYEIWKNIADALNVPTTYIIGAYDFELLPLRFYHDMWNDIGFDAYMDSVLSGNHEYDACLNPGVGLKGYRNQVENEKKFEAAQKTTKLVCPVIKLAQVDMSHH